MGKWEQGNKVLEVKFPFMLKNIFISINPSAKVVNALLNLKVSVFST